MSKEGFSEKQKMFFYMIIATAAVYFGLKYILPLFVPFLAAYFIAWLIRPLVSFLHRKLGIPPVIGGAAAILLLFAAVGTGLFWLGRMLIDQLTAFFSNLPEYQLMLSEQIEGICSGCDRVFKLPPGTAEAAVEENMRLVMKNVQTEVIPALSKQSISVAIGAAGLLGILLIVIVSALLIVKDMESYKERFRDSRFYREIHRITGKLSETGIAYLRTQGIIMLIIAAICTIGLLMIENNYALLIGIGIALFDAFPVLGSGLILIPWAVICLLAKDIRAAVILAVMYVSCQLVREVLEPKMLGNKIGIPPIGTMMAMYVGVKLFGVSGFLLGPVGLIILKTCFSAYSGGNKE